MTITPRLICLLVAAILFVLAAVLPALPTRIGLVPAGLAFLTVSFLLPG